MEWLNIHYTVLNSEEFLDSEPTARATWICLLGYCAVQENGGRIVGSRLWKDRKCQQILRVTHDELHEECDLWEWEGDDCLVTFYPIDKQELIQKKREAGRKGGRSTSGSKKKAARDNGAKHNPSTTQAEAKQEPNGIGKEGEEERKGTNNTTASGDAEAGDFYLTKRKRKLTGKRLEAFNRFWKSFAYPKDKASAADAWLDIPQLTQTLVDTICQAAEAIAAERPSLMAQGKTPQYAQGWINGRRWEDAELPLQQPANDVPNALMPPLHWQKHRDEWCDYLEKDGVNPAKVKEFREAKSFHQLSMWAQEEIRKRLSGKEGAE